MCKYREKHISTAGFFLTIKTKSCQTTDAAILLSGCGNWKNHKNEKNTAFASYRIFLIEINAICFGKVQYIPVWIAREYKSWSLNNIVRLISI